MWLPNFIWIPSSRNALISVLNKPIFITSKSFLRLPASFYPLFCYKVDVQKASFFNSSRPDQKSRDSHCCRNYHQYVFIWMLLLTENSPPYSEEREHPGDDTAEWNGCVNPSTGFDHQGVDRASWAGGVCSSLEGRRPGIHTPASVCDSPRLRYHLQWLATWLTLRKTKVSREKISHLNVAT